MPKKSFDPIYSGHQKNFKTVSKYLIWSGRVNYLVFFVCSTVLLKYFVGSKINDSQVAWIGILSFLPVVTFFYYLSVNRVYWSLLPMNRKNVWVKTILSLWLIFYSLLTIFNLVSYGVSSAIVLNGFWSFGRIISFSGLVMGIIGEFIFNRFDKLIIQGEVEKNEIYEKTGVNELIKNIK